jgi:hypothetical protein
MTAIQRKRTPAFRRQRGQALIYGLFMLACGLTALFFLFNTGQLSNEKTKLVNTADAVAYSAGLLHARALNFDAYTNRAMMANEVLVAQTVSMLSWIEYAQGHVDEVPAMNCYNVVYSIPTWLGLAEYLPLCIEMSWPPAAMAIGYVRSAIEPVSKALVQASELAKLNLQLGQTTMFAALVPARMMLMKEVAEANYDNDGTVKVDVLPLTDDYTDFEGEAFIRKYEGNDRARLREAELAAAHKDDFLKSRAWDSHSPWPCILAARGDASRSGSTTLQGYEDWKASDQASLNVESWHISMFSTGCKKDAAYPLGSGSASARDLGYKGVPTYYELSAKALAYKPDSSDPAKRDPRVRFAIRLTRAMDQTMTSAGRSAVRPSGSMAIYEGKAAGKVMAALSTSEVFFERPVPRDQEKTELASLFNPYWQVHLATNSGKDLAQALTLQTGLAP